jgi:hypothetical protein
MEHADAMTDTELDAVERRADAATSGPWRAYVEGADNDSGDSFIGTDGPDLYVSYDDWPSEQQRAHDLDFIAGARRDVPRLLAEVRRLRAILPPGS